MARLRKVIGRVGESVNLLTRFSVNGVLFNPYAIISVQIQDEHGNVITTLPAPGNLSTGVYQASWTPPAGTAPGIFYDVWTWQAEASMSTQIRSYSFRVDGNYGTDKVIKHTGPLFVTPRELNFFNHMNKELIQRIVAQRITYYSVSQEHTKSDNLYDEAIQKTIFQPVDINARVLYKAPDQSTSQFSIDTIYAIEAYFHIFELKERNIIPREGDFIKYGNTVYEIEKLTRPQITYGQIDHEIMVKAECRVSRKSQFELVDDGKEK